MMSYSDTCLLQTNTYSQCFTGVLRLEKSFQKAKHDDAEVILVRKTLPGAKGDDEVEAEEMKLVPGESKPAYIFYLSGINLRFDSTNMLSKRFLFTLCFFPTIGFFSEMLILKC